MTQAGGAVLVRVHLQSLALYDAHGRRISVLRRVCGLRISQVGQWPAYVQGPQGLIAGRWVALRRSPAATQRVQQRLKRRAQRKQQMLSEKTLEAAATCCSGRPCRTAS